MLLTLTDQAELLSCAVEIVQRMGIPKLTGFVENNFTQWRQRQLRDEPLVIDGMGMCYKLYLGKHQLKFGGDYPAFYDTVQEFFRILRSRHIRPIIVLDGVDYDQTKAKTTLQRAVDKVRSLHRVQTHTSRETPNILPLFTRKVFVEVLERERIEFYVADGEADPDIVAIANHYRCPVLAKDSDFFIFSVTHGYIPLDRFHWKHCRAGVRSLRGRDVHIRADIFTTDSFARQFSLRDPNLRLAIPAILGNDFWGKSRAATIFDLDSPEAVIEYIRQFDSLELFLEHVSQEKFSTGEALRRRCSECAIFYDVRAKSPSTFAPKQSKLLQLLDPSVSVAAEWILGAYRRDRFQHFMIYGLTIKTCRHPVVVDDLSQTSSFRVSLPIRQIIYSIMRVGTVTETVRSVVSPTADAFAPEEVKPKLLPTLPSLSLKRIKALQDKLPDRKHILYMALGCEKVKSLIEELSSEWHLVAVSCIFWYRNADIPPNMAKALVACFLACSTGRYPHISGAAASVPEDSLRVVHASAQWQCVYHDTVALNQLLLEPVRYVSPSQLFSGDILMYYATLPVDCIEKAIPQASLGLYRKLVSLILEVPHQPVKRKALKVLPPKVTFAHKNRFDILQEEDA